MANLVVPATFPRKFGGPVWSGSPDLAWKASDGPGWASNGGAGRKHPARALPLSLEIESPEEIGVVRKLILVGVFARYANLHDEPNGSVGANIHFLGPEGAVLQRIDLLRGVHYDDAADLAPVSRANGDGTVLRTVGEWEDETTWRVDVLEIDVLRGFDSVRLRDMGTPASFVIFDAAYEIEPVVSCPFRGHGAAVALTEVGGILRLRDRARFEKAVSQLRSGIMAVGDDLDEARGTALTFLAVVSAALLELGAPRSTHRAQLDAARRLERDATLDEIAATAEDFARKLAASVLPAGDDPSQALLERAVALVERHFAQEISDADIASKLGLSTSHFRHLFRQHTNQPFHQFLVAVRLEKARELVVSSQMGMSEIAKTVGFASAAHFSRVFHQRFQVAPSALRSAHRITESSAG